MNTKHRQSKVKEDISYNAILGALGMNVTDVHPTTHSFEEPAQKAQQEDHIIQPKSISIPSSSSTNDTHGEQMVYFFSDAVTSPHSVTAADTKKKAIRTDATTPIQKAKKATKELKLLNPETQDIKAKSLSNISSWVNQEVNENSNSIKAKSFSNIDKNDFDTRYSHGENTFVLEKTPSSPLPLSQSQTNIQFQEELVVY